jgi:hypothetical protein
MAQQKVTVEFAPESLERLRRAVTEAIKDGRMTVGEPARPAPILEPVTIQSPDGERFLFIDPDNQEHWIRPREWDAAELSGWRQAWFRAR